jgi:prepilin-type N-terminal cleavage/methylation domain-containing protein
MSGRSLYRRGFTLIELIAAIAVLAIVAGVAGVAVPRTVPPTARDTIDAQVMALRRSAIRSRRAVTLLLSNRLGQASITAYPDGQVVAYPWLEIDPLTGVPDTTRAPFHDGTP